MSDLIFLLVVVAFFAAATGFVRVCDRIVGRADPASVPTQAPALALEEA